MQPPVDFEKDFLKDKKNQKKSGDSSSRNGWAKVFKAQTEVSQMPTLDWIHIIFLFYSAAHNFINAWHRAHSALFFVFVVVGILSVELMLWTIYKHWKDGRLVGKMLRISKFAGALAMFYATTGILAQAQVSSTNEWLTFYYQWILPSSAPVMFFFAFLIQSVDPIMTAERDATAYSHLLQVEEKRDVLDQRRMELDYRRDVRKLKAHIHRQKLIALWKESGSRRTRYVLKKAMQIQMPRIMKSIGIPVDDVRRRRSSIFFWNNAPPARLKQAVGEDDDPLSLMKGA